MKLTPSYLDGAYLALNAQPGLRAFVDAPRCEVNRADKITTLHDRMSDLLGMGPYDLSRRLFTGTWRFGLDIQGPDEAIARTLKHLAGADPHSPILLFRGHLSLLINTDLDGVALESLDTEKTPPLISVAHHSLDDDWLTGYRAVHDAVLDWMLRNASPTPPAGPPRPLIGGFGLLRREGDEHGNVDEVLRLWRALGLETDPIWPFSGGPLDSAGLTSDSPRFIFPYSGDYQAHRTANDDGTDTHLPFPIGLSATAALLRGLGKRFGRETEAESLIARETETLRQAIETTAVERLAGRGVAVLADPTRAIGLCAAMRDLGLTVPLVLSLGAIEADEAENAFGDATVLINPSFSDAVAQLKTAAATGELDWVVGASWLRDPAREAGLAYVECGYPAYTEHFIGPMPYMGYAGLLRLAERLANSQSGLLDPNGNA